MKRKLLFIPLLTLLLTSCEINWGSFPTDASLSENTSTSTSSETTSSPTSSETSAISEISSSSSSSQTSSIEDNPAIISSAEYY